MERAVQNFFDAKTEAGTPAHPYVEEVVDDMAVMIQGAQARGDNPTAEDLQGFYERACWANPGVREKLLADQQRQARAREQAEERKRTEKAKAASSSISGGGGAAAERNGREAPKNESVRDTILRSMQEVANAAG